MNRIYRRSIRLLLVPIALRDRMQRRSRQWSTSRIGRALERLIEAESQAMRAYAIKDEIVQRALMDIAALARAVQAQR